MITLNKIIILINIFLQISAVEIADYQHHEVQTLKEPPIPILKQSFNQHEHGYQYSYETGNGIQVEESGFIKNKGDKDHEILIQQGKITYQDEHGRPIVLTYIADENGFQPQGAHLPTPPPVPEEHEKNLAPPPEEYYQQETHQQYAENEYDA